MHRDNEKLEKAQALADAKKAVEDPAIQRTLKELQGGLVDLIASVLPDTGESGKNFESECCRTLRTVRALQKSLYLPIHRDRIADDNLGMLENYKMKQKLNQLKKEEIN